MLKPISYEKAIKKIGKIFGIEQEED